MRPTKYRDESEYPSSYKRKNIDDKMIVDFMRSLVNGKKQEYENDDVLLKDFMERIAHDSKHGYDEDEDDIIRSNRSTGIKKGLGRKKGEFDFVADIMGDPVKRQKTGGQVTIVKKIFKEKPAAAEDYDTDYAEHYTNPTKAPRKILRLKDRKVDRNLSGMDKFDVQEEKINRERMR